MKREEIVQIGSFSSRPVRRFTWAATELLMCALKPSEVKRLALIYRCKQRSEFPLSKNHPSLRNHVRFWQKSRSTSGDFCEIAQTYATVRMSQWWKPHFPGSVQPLQPLLGWLIAFVLPWESLNAETSRGFNYLTSQLSDQVPPLWTPTRFLRLMALFTSVSVCAFLPCFIHLSSCQISFHFLLLSMRTLYCRNLLVILRGISSERPLTGTFAGPNGVPAPVLVLRVEIEVDCAPRPCPK